MFAHRLQAVVAHGENLLDGARWLWLAVVSRTWCLSGCLWDVSVYALVTIVVVIRFVCSTMLFAVVGPALLVAVAVPRYLLL